MRPPSLHRVAVAGLTALTCTLVVVWALSTCLGFLYAWRTPTHLHPNIQNVLTIARGRIIFARWVNARPDLTGYCCDWDGPPQSKSDFLGDFFLSHLNAHFFAVPDLYYNVFEVPLPPLAAIALFATWLVRRKGRPTLFASLTVLGIVSLLFAVYAQYEQPDSRAKLPKSSIRLIGK